MDFHIGDKVYVLMLTPALSGLVSNIDNLNGVTFYQVDNDPRWWEEDRIDYDLTPMQRSVMLKLEESMQELRVASRNLLEVGREAELILPPWLIKKYRASALNEVSVVDLF